MYARAFAASPNDARVLYEWDQLKKRAELTSPEQRLRSLEEHKELVARRDDLTVEYITLLNQSGQWKAALDQLSTRRFSPWEGGEGLVSAQYVHAHRALGITALAGERPAVALEHFEAARHYPHNLGEGKHSLTLERDLDYFSGLAAQRLGDTDRARRYWTLAAAQLPALGIHSYFQALALRELDDDAASRAILTNLAEYADQLAVIEPKIDYFATSLPNLLLFDDDLGKRNRVDALFLRGLANQGLGDTDSAMRQLEQVLVEDPNHLLAAEILRWLRMQNQSTQQADEGRTAL
jgi:tetratricopeptide (TPR) repeat protein